MAELAEGARLEIERGLIASVGSNPTLPAKQFKGAALVSTVCIINIQDVGFNSHQLHINIRV